MNLPVETQQESVSLKDGSVMDPLTVRMDLMKKIALPLLDLNIPSPFLELALLESGSVFLETLTAFTSTGGVMVMKIVKMVLMRRIVLSVLKISTSVVLTDSAFTSPLDVTASGIATITRMKKTVFELSHHLPI
jgi:hypothetical protein